MSEPGICVVCEQEWADGLQCDACRQGTALLLPRREEPAATPQDDMTRPEREMARLLDALVRTGVVTAWWYECLKLKIGAERCHYTPDFFVQYTDGSFAFIETKGGGPVRDDSRVKFQAAAREYDWAAWKMMRWIKGGWVVLAQFNAH
jgi:hypothetical protein